MTEESQDAEVRRVQLIYDVDEGTLDIDGVVDVPMSLAVAEALALRLQSYGFPVDFTVPF